MRCLKRNQQSFSYCLYKKSVEIIDEYGNETGEMCAIYETDVSMVANISAATGQAQVEQFGNLDNYDKVIVTDDMNCPIDEHSVLFIDKEPEYASVTIRTFADDVDPEPEPEPDPDPDPDPEPEPEPESDPNHNPNNDPNNDPNPDVDDAQDDGDDSGDDEEEIVEVTYQLPKNDYIVKRVARSLNSISIAVRKVEVG